LHDNTPFEKLTLQIKAYLVILFAIGKMHILFH